MSEQNPPAHPGGSSRPPVPGGEPPFWAAPAQNAASAAEPPAGAGVPPFEQTGAPTPPPPPAAAGVPSYGPARGFAQTPGAGYPPYGQPPLQPGGPGRPAPVTAPPGTDFPGKTLGIVGLILAVVVNLAGIIVSAIALSTSRRAGFRNTPALAGVITGSVLLVIGIVVALTFAVIGIASGLSSVISAPYSSSDDGSSVPWATATPDPLGTPSPVDPTDGLIAYEVGDCFDDQADDATSVLILDCSGPHDWEVYSNVTLPDTADGSYPGDDKMQQAADQACYDAFADFIGVAYEDSQYDFGYVTPDKSTWIAYDDRVVTCAAFDPAGPLVGSLRGVAQ